jgi:hypothetical protein
MGPVISTLIVGTLVFQADVPAVNPKVVAITGGAG